VEVRDFQVFGEPGAIVYLADCVDLMKVIPSGSIDVVFADPPYRLSRGGVTVKSGRLAPVNKGSWDRSMGSDRGNGQPFTYAGFANPCNAQQPLTAHS
jgi:site-specific DNA-methyltransferase (adenine-specific)